MRRWQYRLLVCFTIAAIGFCSVALVWAAVGLSRVESGIKASWFGNSFVWKGGEYQISGRMDGGALAELNVIRLPE